MRQRRLLAGGTIAATLATLLIATSPSAAAAQPRAASAATQPASAEQAATRRITLFTGDRVSVTGKQIAVTPRAGVHFVRFSRAQDDYVIPSDAIALLKADRLDERLFNVSALLEFDFDKLDHLPLVVSDATGVRGLSSGRQLPAVDGFATRVPLADLAKTWQTTRTSLTEGKIWLDGVRESTLDASVPMVGAPGAWAAGYDGAGVKVAVLDTGIDDTHPDLSGKVVARHNFVADQEAGRDLTGHGTHVASTIAGTGAASAGRFKGVAPGVSLMDGKVCWLQLGRGVCSDSAILEAMQWAASSGAKVVNMSLSGPDQVGIDPLEQAVNDLSAEYGTLFVCSAGNFNPPGMFSVGSPSTAEAALSVANFTKTGELAYDSLRGPRTGDYGVKPDIAAPGTGIVAARADGTNLGTPVDAYYASLSGTSMASPHVAGSAALLAQANPGWTGRQVKEALMASAAPNPDYDVFAQGTGLVNVARALGQTVTVTPASLSIGVLEWPHTEAPTKRTVTYHNRADQPVTLDLALDGDAPGGLLALSATTLTVPAGGDASVEVIADETASTSYGVYSGRIVATGGEMHLQTPFSVKLEEPAATLNVSAIGRDGGTPGTVMLSLANPGPGGLYSDTFYTANLSLRVPLNTTWQIAAYVEGDDDTITLMTNNKVVVDQNRDVVLDARKARPLDITVPDRDAVAHSGSVAINRAVAGGPPTTDAVVGDPRAILTADLGPTGLPGVVTQVQAVFQGRAKKGGAPDAYQIGWRTEGSFITGLTKHVTRRELATVDVDYAGIATGVVAVRSSYMPESEVPGRYLSSELPPVQMPAHRTEYYSAEVPWRSGVLETTIADGLQVLTVVQAQDPHYRPGDRYRERWNGAVLNITVGRIPDGSPVLVRQGDTLYASFNGLADGDGHIASPYPIPGNRLSLYRGETLLGEFTGTFANFGSWNVAAEPATYRMEYEVELPDPFLLSRRAKSVWTFTTSADQQGEPPLTSIGFRPDLAVDNSSRAGSTLAIPLTFARQGAAGPVKSASVSVSFDDGATWVAAPTVERNGTFTATVQQPKHATGFVALRATAVDDKGNTVTTTVYRAYQLK